MSKRKKEALTISRNQSTAEVSSGDADPEGALQTFPSGCWNQSISQHKQRDERSCVNTAGLCVGISAPPCSVAQSCRLCGTPRTVAHQAPLSGGFPSLEYWSGLSFPPGYRPDPGIEPRSPALQADSLPRSHQGSSPGVKGGWNFCLIPLVCDPFLLGSLKKHSSYTS